MILELDHHSGVPIYRQIIDQIRRQILSGILPPEQQLKSVRELAAELKVNPMTVSKAYSHLEMERLVERKRGVGLFVAWLEYDQKEGSQRDILEKLIHKAVSTAKQFDMSKEQFEELINTVMGEYETLDSVEKNNE